MTANTNQPNKGNQGAGAKTGGTQPGAWAAQHGQKGPEGESGQDEGARFGGAETTRFLDAIEQNVNQLRNAMSGSGRSAASEKKGREGRAARGEREETGSESGRDL